MEADEMRAILGHLPQIDFDALPMDKATELLGQLLDLAISLRDEGSIDHALKLIGRLRARDAEGKNEVYLHYFEGNAWFTKTNLRATREGSPWGWDAEDLTMQVLAYRRAIKCPRFGDMDGRSRSKVYVNLGNAMRSVGRFVDAVGYYDLAAEADPDFGMVALARATLLRPYLASLYDPGHQQVLIRVAHDLLKRASGMDLEPGAATTVQSDIEFLESHGLEKMFEQPLNFPEYPLGENEDERSYRRWCLDNRLFLNPLSDVLQTPVVATDVLCLPDLSGPLAELGRSRSWIGLFNVLKQEFVAARTLYWEGTCSPGHFADNEVVMVETHDGAEYGLGLERVKAALRVAYSVIDKTAYLLNSYLGLNIAERAVSFKGIWFVGGKPSKGLRPEFAERENWPLRGLFWLSKDLESDEALQECIEPQAHDLRSLRNYTEHRYVKVLHPAAEDRLPWWPDEPSLRISTDDLRAKTLHIIRLARAALIYVSLGIHTEERRRQPTGAAEVVVDGESITITP